MKKFIRIINRIEEYTLGLTLLTLAIFACVQVFTRYILNHSFSWFEELSQFTCVFITFLGAGLGVKYSAHFSMTALVDRLPFRAQRLVTALVYLICTAFFVTVAYYGVQHCLKHYKFGNLSAAMRLPMYVPYLPIPFFSAVMAGRCLIISGNNAVDMVRGPKTENEAGEEAAE